MNKFLLLFCFCSSGIISCSQTKYGIKHVYAFFSLHMPGNILIDENGRPLQKGPAILNIIYVETSAKDIQWTTAWQNGKKYSVSTTRITELPFEVGRKKINNEKIVLSPASGNKLWLLRLEPAEEAKGPTIKTKNGEIILEGRYEGRKFFRKINDQTELYVPPSV